MQLDEISKPFYYELKVLDFLINSLFQLQYNLKQTNREWGKNLGLKKEKKKAVEEDSDDDNDNEDVDGSPSNLQDELINNYLESLANFIECERVTLYGYHQQIIKDLNKKVEKVFVTQENKLKNLKIEKEKDLQALDRLKQYGDDAEAEKLKEQMNKKYGEDLEEPRLIKAE